MRTHHFRFLVGALLIGGLWVVPAAAQTPRATLSGGYQFVDAGAPLDESFGMGWYADISGNFTRMLGAVFQVGGNYKSLTETATMDDVTIKGSADVSIHQFMGGIRVTAPPNATVKPFAHFMAGGVRLAATVDASVTGVGISGSVFSDASNDTRAAIQTGGGVDFLFTKAFGVRAGADYGRIFDSDQDMNLFRFTVGAVFPF